MNEQISPREQLVNDFYKWFNAIEVPEQMMNNLYWCAVGHAEQLANHVQEMYNMGELSQLECAKQLATLIEIE